jgi:hypothetical protein
MGEFMTRQIPLSESFGVRGAILKGEFVMTFSSCSVAKKQRKRPEIVLARVDFVVSFSLP